MKALTRTINRLLRLRKPLRSSHPNQFLNHHRFWRYT